MLHFHDASLPLTITENRLLSLLVRNQNVMVPRAHIQKEIWEDQGVIVGRSLDVFISRLRKKLETDPGIQLKNIHGKGYLLDVGG